jgi:hypothetical protein
MLDIHPAHHAASTWRDFFIHIITIVLGLLIAIGLEQTVEYIHHRHQREELREALRQDADTNARDAFISYGWFTAYDNWTTNRIAQVHEAIRSHRPLAAPALKPSGRPAPDQLEPAWNAAKSSGLMTVLPQDEIKAYAEVDRLFGELERGIYAGTEAEEKMRSFESGFCEHACDDKSFADASMADLREYIRLLKATQLTLIWTRGDLRDIFNAETAILQGHHDLATLQQVEYQPMPSSLPQTKP